MNTRPARVPNMDPTGYLAGREQRRAERAELAAFLDSFDRQVAEIEAHDQQKRKEDQE